MKKKSFLIGFFFSLVLVCLGADTVEMKNGDTFSGHISSVTETEISIETEYGLITVKREFVVRALLGSETISDTDNEIESEEASDDISSDNESANSDENVTEDTNVITPALSIAFNNSFSIESQYDVTVEENSLSVFCDDKDGEKRSAVYSTGTGTYMILDPVKEISDADAITVEFDAQFHYANRAQYLISMWEKTDGEKAEGKFAICYQQNKLIAYLVDENGQYYQYITSGYPISLDTWHNIIVTIDKDEIVFYVDYEVVDKFQTSFSHLGFGNPRIHLLTAVNATTPVNYGRYNLNGCMDNFALYTQSFDEIALFND